MADPIFIILIGRLGITAADGVDPDEDPDTIWCDEGVVRFTPVNTYVKAAAGSASPIMWDAGQAVIDVPVGQDGYLTYSGVKRVRFLDLTDPGSVNPVVPEGKATHRVEFRSVKASGVDVGFPATTVRIAADTARALTEAEAAAVGLPTGTMACVLAELTPVPTAGGTPIIRGERGVGIADLAVEGVALIATLDDGSEVSTDLPAPLVDSDAAVAALVEGPDTATASALNAATAAQIAADAASPNGTIPATIKATAAPIRPHPLLGFFAALAQRDTTPVDILALGDSIFEGVGASTLTNRSISRMVAGLRTRLGVTGGGVGYIPARYQATDRQATDGWTTTGNTVDNTFGFGQRSRYLLLDSDTGKGDGTMTRTVTCTSFTLIARCNTTATSLFVSIDGGADVVWDIAASATGAMDEFTSGALSAGSHTVRIKARSQAGCAFLGIMVYNGDENSGIRLWDGAKSGTRADQFNAESGANSALWADELVELSPDLAIIEWITNDAITRTAAQYETSIRNVIALLRSKASDVPILLLAPYERGDQALIEPWANYTAKLAKIAGDTAHVAFLDLGQAIPKPNGADTYGLLSDGIHPNDKGHALIGDLLAGFLTPRPA